jgi:phosphoribosylanthranilate isomerase
VWVRKIKFCGITTLDDARLAVDAGAWAIGLNFWPRSPRRCDLDTAAEVTSVLRRRVEIAGVFVNAPLEHVTRIADALDLSILQLHGDEGPAYCAEAGHRTGCKVIKAMRVRSGADIQALAGFHTDYHLLDSYMKGVPGGTGETFAWDLAREHRGPAPVILSGGLTPDNVAEAIEVVRPFAVDVASGTEPTGGPPTRKDPDKLEAFAAAVAGAHARLPRESHATPGSATTRAPRNQAAGRLERGPNWRARMASGPQARADAERGAGPRAHATTPTFS